MFAPLCPYLTLVPKTTETSTCCWWIVITLFSVYYTIKKSFIKRSFWYMFLFGQLVKVKFSNQKNILWKIVYAIIRHGKAYVNFNIFLKGKRIY